MGETTAISWTSHTFNSHWGCTKIGAPGPEGSACDNCYAEAFAHRLGLGLWGKDADRRLFGDKHWNEPLRWNRAAEAARERRRVFCASMADVFEDRRDLDPVRARLYDLIAATPWLDWQLLTKRPEQVPRLADRWMTDGWPTNVWLGTTVESQAAANLRVPRLLAVPARVRFLSVEPMLGPVVLSRWIGVEWMDALRLPGEPVSALRGEGGWGAEMFFTLAGRTSPIGWVICGGESGPGHRPLNLDWARDLRDQCAAAEVPYFFKQTSGPRPGQPGPPDLHVKEFPRANA